MCEFTSNKQEIVVVIRFYESYVFATKYYLFCPRRSVYVEDYNIALIVVVSRCSLFVVVVSTLKNLRTTTQMLMKLGQCYF